jgi:hypothetical protein
LDSNLKSILNSASKEVQALFEEDPRWMLKIFAKEGNLEGKGEGGKGREGIGRWGVSASKEVQALFEEDPRWMLKIFAKEGNLECEETGEGETREEMRTGCWGSSRWQGEREEGERKGRKGEREGGPTLLTSPQKSIKSFLLVASPRTLIIRSCRLPLSIVTLM